MKEDEFFLPNFCELKTLTMLCLSAQLLSFVLILAMGDELLESWDELGLLSIFIQWIVLCSAGALCLCRRFLAKLSLMQASFISYCLILTISAIIAWVAQYFMLIIGYQWGNSPETLGAFVYRCVTISAVMDLLLLRYFYVRQQWKMRVKLESQARIDALHARIKPHFLFNSMNIIASLIVTNPAVAERAVEDLSELFRATLKDSGSMVTFKEEWCLCEDYLRIEKLRLGERLVIKTDFQEIPDDMLIPMLTLQPLIENAIYHGIQPLPKGGVIEITSAINNGNVKIQIINPVPQYKSDRMGTGNKIAMVNITNRLNLLFGSRASLSAVNRGSYFEVELIIPYTNND